MGQLRGLLVPALSITLTACAGIDVVPVSYDGQPKPEQHGIRYYMPKPYLLVTRNPTLATTGGVTGVTCDNTGCKDRYGRVIQGGPAAGGNNQKPAKDEQETQKAGDGVSAGGSGSDLSYQIGNDIYFLKLIYLPDMSKSMAINLTPSILGTVSFQPTLQDGWMLTSINASADNTKALDSLTTLATTLAGSAAKTTKATTQGTPPATQTTVSMEQVLPPGLYEFQYDDEGRLVGLCMVSRFDSAGASKPRARSGNYCSSLAAISRLPVKAYPR